MDYFVLEVHGAYISPQINSGTDMLDLRNMNQKSEKLKTQYKIYPISEHMQMVYTDIMMSPCFMVSKKAMEVIRLYEPHLDFEYIALHCKERKETKVYYIPKLEEKDILISNHQGKQIEIDGSQLGKQYLFQVTGGHQKYILIYYELVESLLRRKAVGMGLTEANVVYPHIESR
ncbi:MAG: hypothetical protein FWE25_09915 [Lachnospiraceae bacterium]|nr:hypothetical protein [Lachnospiraceae bacterium]